VSQRLKTFLLINLAIFVVVYPLLLFWLWSGGREISWHGWVAATGGIALTWWLGVGLMAALFASGDGSDDAHRM
jgi:hypothetical protein